MDGVDVLVVINIARILTGVGILTYACVTDWRTRRAPNSLWIIMLGLGAAFIVAEYLLVGFSQSIWYLGFIPVMWVLMFLLFQLGLMFGGADAKALMALAVLVPFWPIIASFPLFVSVMPFSWVVFVNSLIVFLVIPLALILWNLSHGDVRFPHLFLGYRMNVGKAKKRFVWPMERIVDGKRRLVLRPMALEKDDDEQDEEEQSDWEAELTREMESAFEFFEDDDDVWVTPKIPFMIPLLIGFILSFVVGDILSYVMLKIMGV